MGYLPIPNFAWISCWGLKVIQKSAYLAQALQLGINPIVY